MCFFSDFLGESCRFEIWRLVSWLLLSGRSWRLMPGSWRGSSTVCPAMTRWASPSVEPVGDPLKDVWSMPWASSGTWRWDARKLPILKWLQCSSPRLYLLGHFLRKCDCLLLSVFSTVTVKSSPAFVLPLFYHVFLFSLPSFTCPCSTTCAQCASAPFRATRFTSEGVTPIVKGILTWWGLSRWACWWLLPLCIQPAWETAASAWSWHSHITPEVSDLQSSSVRVPAPPLRSSFSCFFV